MISTAENGLDRNFVGRITIGNDSRRLAEFSGFAEQRNSLRRVSVRGQMKPDNKSCFAVNDEPDIMLYTGYFNYRFIGVSFIGIKV